MTTEAHSAHPIAAASFRGFAPIYASADTLAYLLDLEPATIRAYVRAGLLPPAETLGRVKRWNVADVIEHIRAQNGPKVDVSGTPVTDPYSMRIKRHGAPAHG